MPLTPLKPGDRFCLTTGAARHYGNVYANCEFVVSGVFTSKDEHPGYDPGVDQPLYESDALPFAVYQYEIERC